MAEYPALPRPIDPVTIIPIWKTSISTFDSGKEQRRQKWDFPKYDVELSYGLINPRSSMQILWDFYMDRKGAAEAFYYYVKYSGSHKAQYVGQGDGATVTFDLPGKSTSSQAIYIDGAPQVDGYTILVGGGSENSDRVQFTAARPSGEIITCDFTGFLRIPCRFAEDKMSEQRFYQTCYTVGIKLRGLSFA